MQNFTPYSFILIVLLFASCGWFKESDDGAALARVDDKYLFIKDLFDEVDFSNSSDSAELIENYIDNWVKEQLLIFKAKQNLSEDELNFDKQIENYLNSLIVYAYENKLVTQKLKAEIADTTIKNYYDKNSANFELSEPLIKGRYIHLISSAPKQDSIKKWILGELVDDELYLSEYCTQFANDCQLDPEKWLAISSLANKFINKNTEELLNSISLGYNLLSDSSTVLIVDVEEIAHTGDIAPLTYVKSQIKSIIRNKNRSKLLAKARKEIYEEATLKKKYEIYYKN